MTGPLDTLSEEDRRKAVRREQPSWAAPMLATLTHEPFSDAAWIYERKLDGVRALAFLENGRARLVSRNRESLDATYPELIDALESLDPPDGIYDGEVTAFSRGVSSFSRLQQRMGIRDEVEARERAKRVKVRYYAFDVLHLEGHDVTELPLRSRKGLLRVALEFGDPIHFTRHRNEDGLDYLEKACGKGWEGLIAKKADSGYVHARSRDWLKFKCTVRQELVVGGFTDPKGGRIGFGALLVGYYEGGELVYAGKVGTGYDDDTLRELGSRLRELERGTSPFEAGEVRLGSGVHWVTPELVAEVSFTEWTEKGRLRHPSFLGLRTDKDPEDVVRERPVEP